MSATTEVLELPRSDGAVELGQAVLHWNADFDADSPVHAVESQHGANIGQEPSEPRWFNAEAIPALRLARIHSEAEHDEIYEERMTFMREGDAASVPIEVDPVTAGVMVLEARQLYGEDSWQYREKREGLVINSRRFLGETGSKYGAEYFDFLWQPYDEEADDYMSYGTASSQVTKNGITPMAEDHEIPRRRYDHTETVVNRELGKSLGRVALLTGEQTIENSFLPVELREAEVVSSVTVCELPTAIKQRWIEDEAKGIQRPYGGYAPQDDKLMIRRTRYTKGTQGRDFDQLALPGRYITHSVIQKYWISKGILSRVQADIVSQDEAQSVQTVVPEDISPLDVALELDRIASEESDKNIFLGEEVDTKHPKDYAAVPAEAAARQAKLESAAEELSDYVLKLAAEKVNHFLANGYYENKAKSLMLVLARDDIELAGRAFDLDTAAKFQSALSETALGNFDQATRLILEAEAMAPPLEGCGAGSCDLVAVGEQTGEATMAGKAGLVGEKLLFKKSNCIDCPKAGTVIFDKRGNMFCTNCHASKVEGVITHGKKDTKSILLPLTDSSKSAGKKRALDY